MLPWSKATFSTPDEMAQLIALARASVRRGAPNGVGVFKARESLTLYFSPVATKAMDANVGLSRVECACPNELSVEVVVGAWDEPGWYDRTEEEITDELDTRLLDVMGFLGPDKDLDEARAEFVAKGVRAA